MKEFRYSSLGEDFSVRVRLADLPDRDAINLLQGLLTRFRPPIEAENFTEYSTAAELVIKEANKRW